MALSVAALGWLHLDAILLVGAHAVVVVLPLVAEARFQSAQVSWLSPPDSGVVGELATFVAGTTAIGRLSHGGDCSPSRAGDRGPVVW